MEKHVGDAKDDIGTTTNAAMEMQRMGMGMVMALETVMTKMLKMQMLKMLV
jgi:hypothetical protein